MFTARALPAWLAGMLTVLATANAAPAPPDLNIVVLVATTNIGAVGSEAQEFITPELTAEINQAFDAALADGVTSRQLDRLTRRLTRSIDRAFKPSVKEIARINRTTTRALTRFGGTPEHFSQLADAVFASSNIIEIEKQSLLDLIAARRTL